MSGTDLAYGATPRSRITTAEPTRTARAVKGTRLVAPGGVLGISLRAPYAMSGTELVMSGTELVYGAISLRAPYAMSGTDLR
eukprot:1606335-Rhodomonas_salina.1